MKIAFVNTNRGWGGAEEQMLVMARELTRRGHDVTVIVRRGGPMEERFDRSGYAVLPVDRSGIRAAFSPFRAAVRARENAFEVIHCHRDHDLPLGKLLSLSTGSPLLLTQHCLPHRPNWLIYGLADLIVTVSEYIAHGIRAKLPSVSDRVGVIVNGIDLAQFSDPDRQFWRRHPFVGDRSPLLGTVGAFYKGQEELISMLPALQKRFPRVMLLLIGEDEGRKAQLVARAEQLGVIDAVLFAGRIPREQMKDALSGLDLNVSAFRNEGFGLSVVEGLAVGTPFVGYNAGGYPEIITNVEFGTLVDYLDDMTDAIINLLTDPRTERKDACVAGAERFTLSQMADAYENIYRRLKNWV